MSDGLSPAEAFGRCVRQQREQRHWTRVKLGSAAGVTGQYISYIELGRHTPSLDTVLRIAYAFGISGADMVRMVEEMRRPAPNA